MRICPTCESVHADRLGMQFSVWEWNYWWRF